MTVIYDNAIDNIAKTKSLGKNRMAGILKACENEILEPSPSATYYLDEANPYKAKYGDDRMYGERKRGLPK